MAKRIISILLVLELILIGLYVPNDKNVASVKATNSYEIWDGSVATSFAGGTGTEDDPYLISNGAELAYFGKCVDENELSCPYVKIIDDIYLNDISDYNNWESNPPKNLWNPIGSERDYYNAKGLFGGVLDGQNHKICGMYIKSGDENVGFFSSIKGGNISNLCIASSYVERHSTQLGAVGCLAGCVYPNVPSSYYNTPYSKTTYINNVSCNAIVKGEDYSIGGIIGYLMANSSSCHNEITGCSFDGKVIRNENQEIDSSHYYKGTGGVIGNAECNFGYNYITECSNYGDISGTILVGGLIGHEDMTYGSRIVRISRCYNVGTIRGNKLCGGLVGETGGDYDVYSLYSDCYNAGNIISNNTSSIGGLIGKRHSTTRLRNCYSYNSSNLQRKVLCGTEYPTLGRKLNVYINCYSIGDGYGFDSEGVCISGVDEKDSLYFDYPGFDFDNVWAMEYDLERPVLRSNPEGTNFTPKSNQAVYEYNGIVDAVRKYSTDNETLKKMLLNVQDKDLPENVKMELISSICTQYGFDDVHEGIDYVQDANSAQRAYQTLINNEQYGSWQFGYYLNNTTKGKVARGLLYTNGMIFNNEMGTWINPSTYADCSYSKIPGVKKYKTLLTKFIEYDATEAEALAKAQEVIKVYNQMKPLKSLDDKVLYNKLLDTSITDKQRNEIIGKLFEKEALLTKTDKNGNKYYVLTTEDKAFDEAFGISAKTINVVVDGTDDILAFFDFKAKVALYNQYNDFFDEIIKADDLPGELRYAAYDMKEEVSHGYLMPLKNLILNGINNGVELSDEICEIKNPDNLFSEPLKTIKMAAFCVNLLVDMGGVVKNAAYTNGYAYLSAHYANALEESRIRFSMDESVENAWDFYDKYNILYRLRIAGEKTYLELNSMSPDGIMGWGGFLAKYMFDYNEKKDLVERNITHLQECCKFVLPDNIKIPDGHIYSAKMVVNCPVDVEVRSAEGDVIARIPDGEEEDVTNEYGRFISQYKPIRQDYCKIIYLNNADKYKVTLKAVNSGHVSVETINMTDDIYDEISGDANHSVVGFINKDICKGDIIDIASGEAMLCKSDNHSGNRVSQIKLSNVDDEMHLLIYENRKDDVGEQNNSVPSGNNVSPTNYSNREVDATPSPSSNNSAVKEFNSTEEKATTTETPSIEKDSDTNNKDASNDKHDKTNTTEAPSGSSSTSDRSEKAEDVKTDDANSIIVGSVVKDAFSGYKYRVTSIGNQKNTVSFYSASKKLKSVSIPAEITVNQITYKVTSVYPGVFKNNKNLRKLVIGKNVRTIGKSAFSGCKKLKTVEVMSTSLKKIDKNAFKKCHKKCTFKVPKKKYKQYKKMFKKARIKSKLVISKTSKKKGSFAFGRL